MAETTSKPFDLQEWIKSNMTMVYVAAGALVLFLFMRKPKNRKATRRISKAMLRRVSRTAYNAARKAAYSRSRR